MDLSNDLRKTIRQRVSGIGFTVSIAFGFTKHHVTGNKKKKKRICRWQSKLYRTNVLAQRKLHNNATQMQINLLQTHYLTYYENGNVRGVMYCITSRLPICDKKKNHPEKSLAAHTL